MTGPPKAHRGPLMSICHDAPPFVNVHGILLNFSDTCAKRITIPRQCQEKRTKSYNPRIAANNVAHRIKIHSMEQKLIKIAKSEKIILDETPVQC
jgi:hypothetical protein